MAILKTVCGIEFEVDDEDVSKLEGASFHRRGKYVSAYWPSSGWGKNDQKQVYVHVFLAAINDHEHLKIEVDHEDGNTLNNKKDNLKRVTKAQQNYNRAAWGQYPQGISYDANKELYRARVQVNGRRIGLGRFKKLEDAIAARKKFDVENNIHSGGI